MGILRSIIYITMGFSVTFSALAGATGFSSTNQILSRLTTIGELSRQNDRTLAEAEQLAVYLKNRLLTPSQIFKVIDLAYGHKYDFIGANEVNSSTQVQNVRYSLAHVLLFNSKHLTANQILSIYATDLYPREEGGLRPEASALLNKLSIPLGIEITMGKIGNKFDDLEISGTPQQRRFLGRLLHRLRYGDEYTCNKVLAKYVRIEDFHVPAINGF